MFTSQQQLFLQISRRRWDPWAGTIFTVEGPLHSHAGGPHLKWTLMEEWYCVLIREFQQPSSRHCRSLCTIFSSHLKLSSCPCFLVWFWGSCSHCLQLGTWGADHRVQPSPLVCRGFKKTNLPCSSLNWDICTRATTGTVWIWALGGVDWKPTKHHRRTVVEWHSKGMLLFYF